MKHAGLFITTMFFSVVALILIINVFIHPGQGILIYATIVSGIANGLGRYTYKKMNESEKRQKFYFPK